jgi:hypothetical protein
LCKPSESFGTAARLKGKIVQTDLEGDILNQPQVHPSAVASRTNRREISSRQQASRSDASQQQSSHNSQLDTGSVLDAAYNRIQELMQLLYLLSRDTCVPSDARYHVTIAQSEIALLSRIVQNSRCAAAEASHARHPV